MTRIKPSMHRILLGQSYYLRFDPKLYAAMQPYPPLGTLYAASYLRSQGHDVALFDAMLGQSEREWEAALDRQQPRYAVLYEDNFNYLSKMCLLRMRQAALKMIEVAKARGCTVILCGADATDHPALYLQQGADFVLLGEGEETLAELMAVLERREDRSFESILGLAWQDSPGELLQNPRRPDITQLDRLPFPAWDLVDVARYERIWMRRHGFFSMNMVTTRGCPYHCNWCAKPIWGQRYNSRSPENVVEELCWLKAQYRPQHICFADDIFGLRPGWIERFGQLVQQRDGRIPFKCLMRPDLVTAPVVEGLSSAGCQTVWMGAESGSQKILHAMDKGTTVGQIGQARKLLDEAGIQVGLFLQFGYPGETRADIEATVQMVRDLLPEDIGISVSYPLPGTKFFDRVRSQLGPKQNWVDSDDMAMLYRGPFSEAFYRTLYRVVHSDFRVRRRIVRLKREGFVHPRSLRTVAAILYHWMAWLFFRFRLRGVSP